MTKAELIEKAVAMGLGTNGALAGMTNKDLEAMIAANADAGTDANKPTAAGEDRGDDPRTAVKAKVVIEYGEGEIGKAPVFAGINGYTIQAPRGVPVDMDTGFVKYLKGLRVDVLVNEFDKDGKITGSRTESRAMYNITDVE